jgi:hypothetical protein
MSQPRGLSGTPCSGQIEVPVPADDRAEDLRRQAAQLVLDARLGDHISVPAVSMIGRTSTAQNFAAGSRVAISVARSMFSQSST